MYWKNPQRHKLSSSPAAERDVFSGPQAGNNQFRSKFSKSGSKMCVFLGERSFSAVSTNCEYIKYVLSFCIGCFKKKKEVMSILNILLNPTENLSKDSCRKLVLLASLTLEEQKIKIRGHFKGHRFRKTGNSIRVSQITDAHAPASVKIPFFIFISLVSFSQTHSLTYSLCHRNTETTF